MFSLERHPEGARQAEPECLVVILPAGEQYSDVETRIKETQIAWASSARQLKFVVVADKNNDGNDFVAKEIIASEIYATVATLGEAIKFAADQTATYGAVIDSGVRFDPENMSWLLRSAKDASIACCYQLPQRSGKWYAVAFDGMASLVSRMLLRTGKHDQRIGVAVFQLARMEPLLDENPVLESVEELIAVCRCENAGVFEAARDASTSNGIGDSQSDAVTLRSTAARLVGHVRCWWREIAFPNPLAPNPLARRASESDVESDAWTAKTKWIASVVLVLLAAILLFSNLGYPLLEPDEARNAQLGLNVYQSGDWLSQKLQGDPYLDKPPLQAWMTAISFHVLGPSEFATRLPCAIASLLTVLMMLILGGMLFEFRAGFAGACLLLLCCGFSVIGRYVTMDASLTCFATAMFFGTLLGVRNYRRTETVSRFWMVFAGIACGLGFMTKGPVIAVLVLPPILLLGWLERSAFYRSWRFWLYPGIAAFVISAPWFITTGIVNPEFVTYFFWKHNVVRFSDAFNHQQPWWFYAPMLLLLMYPACLLLPSLAKLMIAPRSEKRLRGDQFGAVALYAIWIVGFFSLSDSKLPTYILPALPAICLLLGKMLSISVFANSQAIQTGHWLRTTPLRATLSATAMIGVVIGVLMVAFAMTSQSFLVLASVLMVTAIGGVALLLIGPPAGNAAWGSVALICFIFVATATTQLFPKFAESRSVFAEISKLIDQPQYAESPVVFVGRPPHGSSFLIPGKQVMHFENNCIADAVEFIASHPNAILVASKDQLKNIDGPRLFDVEITKSDSHRNVYITHEKPNRLERSARSHSIKSTN